MIKTVGITKIIIIASLAVALVAAAVGVTFAWYSTHVTIDKQLEFSADGMLIIYFNGEPDYHNEKLKPATAAKGAIEENVTDFGTVTSTGTYITEAATTVTTSVSLSYRNSSSTGEEQSEPTNTEISADVIFTAGAKLKLGENEKILDVPYDVTVVLNSVTVDYVYDDTNNVVYSEENSNAVDFGDTITVLGDCDIIANITIYFTHVDDLIDPDILATLYDEQSSMIILINGTIDGQEP